MRPNRYLAGVAPSRATSGAVSRRGGIRKTPLLFDLKPESVQRLPFVIGRDEHREKLVDRPEVRRDDPQFTRDRRESVFDLLRLLGRSEVGVQRMSSAWQLPRAPGRRAPCVRA